MMLKTIQNYLLVGSSVLTVCLLGVGTKAIANETPEPEPSSLDQITNVSQLEDVQPGDWAYEALRSLVERYGCIAGYPNGTFRGNRSLTRYEFAAGVNACLRQIERLIASGTASGSTKQDLVILQRLTEEFAPQLAILRGRVDGLQARITELERLQFSPTTKLNGEVVWALNGIFTGENALNQKIDTNIALGSRVRLNFDTSFTGRDLLKTRLQFVNQSSFSQVATFTPEGDLGFNSGLFEEGSSQVSIDTLFYSFPISNQTSVYLAANAGGVDDFIATVNPYFDVEDGAGGALSYFGIRSPIYYIASDNAGIGIRHEFSDQLELGLGYLADTANQTTPGNGLFNGGYGAIAQLTIKPSEKLSLGLTYVNSYNKDLTTGSNRANLRSSLMNNPALAAFGAPNLPISSNSYGVEASWQLSPKFVLGGWAGYTATRILSTLDGTIPRGDLSIWHWAVTLGFPDLGKKGNLGGIIVGMEPKVTSVSNALKDVIGTDPNTSLHIEGFYQYQLTDNIGITPGVIWLTAPDHNNNNNDVVIGVVRTTFSF